MKSFFGVIFFVLAGCSTFAMADRVVTDFFLLSDDEQDKQFYSYTIEQQFEILIYGNQRVHPPVIHLATLFAQRGSEVVPFLKMKLQETSNQLTIRDIVVVFVRMDNAGLYDFSKDDELSSLIVCRVASVNDNWKPILTNVLSEFNTVEFEPKQVGCD